MTPRQTVPTAAVLAAMPDNRWRTLHDIAIALERNNALPLEEVLRQATPGDSRDRVTRAYAKMAVPTLEVLADDGRVETREVDGATCYRPVVTPTRAQPADPADLTRPANTDTGISQLHLYRLVGEREGITEDELLEALEACWKSDEDLLKVYLATASGKKGQQGDTPKWVEKLSPDERSRHVKRQLVRRYIQRCEGAGKMRRETVVKLYLLNPASRPAE